MKICNNCIFDEKTPGISFNDAGICNYCEQVGALLKEYGTGTQVGIGKFELILNEMKRKGKKKKLDEYIILNFHY